MWALDPFTKSNGATRFVIGSHRFMKFPQNGKVYKGEKVVEVPTGSAIIFNGSLWHGSSQTKKNLTRRWGLICRYARWFCKPSFDFQKNTCTNNRHLVARWDRAHRSDPQFWDFREIRFTFATRWMGRT